MSLPGAVPEPPWPPAPALPSPPPRWLQTFMAFVRLFDSRASRAMNLLADLILEEK